MRIRLFCLSIFFLTHFFFKASGQDTLLLFHPTAYNLEVMQNLMDEAIFSPEGVHILGVFHQGEAYDYELARSYLREHPSCQFSLEAVTGELQAENIFGENPCSSQFRSLFSRSKGALFMGGPDIPPATYNEKVHLLTLVTDPFRHYFELSYLFHLLGGNQMKDWIPCMEKKPGYLVSGICLGMQTMNVATGGTMIQDIPTEIYDIWNADDLLAGDPDQMHRNYADMTNTGCDMPTSYHFHRIKLKEKEFLTDGLGFTGVTSPLVLSAHHQALEKLGKGWVVAATSMDGKIIEALRHIEYAHVFGVQFHPEKPGLFNPTIAHPQNCNSTINFQEAIKGTDSYAFHLAYWKYLESILLQK